MALRMMLSPEIEVAKNDNTTARTVKMYYYHVPGNCLGMYD
jgi:hypothetical protein